MERRITTETGTFLLRAYSDTDEAKSLALWKQVFGKELPVEVWRWKYTENPFGHQILLCMDGQDEIVALYGGIPYLAWFQGRPTRVTQLMDIMTHPRVRKTGLFVKAAHCFFEFAKNHMLSPIFLYGFPGQYHLSIGVKYLGYEECTSKVSFLQCGLKTKRNRTTSRTPRLKQKVRGITQNDIPLFDKLWERVQNDFSLSVIRDAAFVKWRFMDHPTNKYEIFGMWEEADRLIGYLIICIEERIARIVDILVPKSEAKAGELLRGTFDMIDKSYIETIVTWLPSSHFIAKYLLRIGFEEVSEPLGIVSTVRRLESASSLEWISDNLFYTMADGDLF